MLTGKSTKYWFSTILHLFVTYFQNKASDITIILLLFLYYYLSITKLLARPDIFKICFIFIFGNTFRALKLNAN